MTGNFLVVGAGLSGLSFALRAAQRTKVTILSKTELIDSSSSLAQGGIAAVQRLPDNYSKHISDTIQVGQGLSNRKAVELMVKYGPLEIQWLIDQGVDFSYLYGELDLTREGGHSARRVVHAGDITGYNVQETLIQKARENPNIRIIEGVIAVDLIMENGVCTGVSTIGNGELGEYKADTVVLCTGGAGQIFAKTSNPVVATGDGVAMAHRAGAIIRDMEFYQFHPSILDDGDSPYFLISEAVRGEGGVLVNSKGEAFMDRYHTLHDLAPRDVVSRAIVSEQRKGQVYIDIRDRGKAYLTQRFPGIYAECMVRGIRMDEDLIPVSPAAHYMCGGVKVNEYGETSIKGLLAFGETGCSGVHGANRLASNSTLECMAFTHLANERVSISDSDFPVYTATGISKLVKPSMEVRGHIQNIMWGAFGIIRKLDEMENYLYVLEKTLEKTHSEPIENLHHSSIEDRNLATIASLVAKSAVTRLESRGTHKLDEYPDRDDENWLKHIEIKENKVTLVDH